MAVPDRAGLPTTTNQTEQYVLNYSFDEVFKILTVGLAGYNATSNTMDRLQLNTDGSLRIGSGLITAKYDYIGAAYPNATTEVYTYKVGGSGGTTVTTITVAYVDSTKANITSVTKS